VRFENWRNPLIHLTTTALIAVISLHVSAQQAELKDKVRHHL
jgi:hypothetical protein